MINIKCQKCKSSITIAENIPANVKCQKCGWDIVTVKSDNSALEYLTVRCSTCGRKNVILNGTTITAYHDFPNCKSYIQEFYSGIKADESGIDIPRARMDDYDVSVVIVCKNNLQYTKECVECVNSNPVKKEIILVDNGSTDGTSEWAALLAKEDKNFIYIKNQVNIGCGIGRNQGAKWARSDYILFLDNDQFIPPDLITRMLKLNKDLVGVELWRVASVDGYTMPAGEMEKSCYLGSGGLLIKRKVFEVLKGYDERFSPAWFEDADFSFRAKLNGFTLEKIEEAKVRHIGGSTTTKQKDYDSKKAKRTSQYLFAELWWDYIDKNKYPVNICPSKKKNFTNKPIVLMVVDEKGWAWDIKAHQLKGLLSDEFDIIIVYHKDIITKGFPIDNPDIFFTFECNFARFASSFDRKRTKLITGVTAHTYTNFKDFTVSLANADALHANSILLLEEVKKFNKKCYYVPNGVNLEKFHYVERNIRKTFTVGYVGKPTIRKGYHQFVVEACDKAGVKLKAVTAKVSDKERIPHNEMQKFYEDIDVIMIASDMDGTPNMLLEAAAVGRTFIGNKIGNVPEFVITEKGKINGYLVNRDVDEYVKKIQYLKRNRKTCKTMGVRARETVENDWSWEKQSNNYRLMFREVLL